MANHMCSYSCFCPPLGKKGKTKRMPQKSVAESKNSKDLIIIISLIVFTLTAGYRLLITRILICNAGAYTRMPYRPAGVYDSPPARLRVEF